MIERMEKLADKLWLNKYSISENGKYGVCDASLNIILPVIFDDIEISPDKQIIGKIDGMFYYFNVRFENNKIKAEITSAFYVDTNGTITEDEEVFYGRRLHEISENLWEMYSNDKKKVGIIDSLGNTVIPFEYDILAGLTAGQYKFIYAVNIIDKFRMVEKCGMFDKEGNVVIPVMYERLENFNEDLAAAKLNGKYGFINIYNELKIPYTYDYVHGWSFYNGKALVELNGEKFYIDKSGKRIK